MISPNTYPLAGLYTGTIFNSIARKMLPNYWYHFLSKKEVAWKNIFKKKTQNTMFGGGGGGGCMATVL